LNRWEDNPPRPNRNRKVQPLAALQRGKILILILSPVTLLFKEL
jgi:hypothetical protein